jgi:carbonic anhydrase/acetyltransferase-like protein (isoleucine patch superfamily)
LTIGRNSIIAVNSVVMRSIPPYSVVAGYPATIIRQYDPETGAWRVGRKGSGRARNTEGNVPLESMSHAGELIEKAQSVVPGVRG